MLRNRTPAVVTSVATSVVMAAIISSAAPVAGASEAEPEVGGPAAEPQQITDSADGYVVVFDEARETDFLVAVEEAGGRVVDVTEPVNMALVAAENESFLDEVRDADAVVSAVRNHPVGAVEPDSHPFDEEWPSEADTLAAQGDRSGVEGPSSEPPRHPRSEPLADRQWGMEMIGATPSEAHRRATGDGVSVGIIDTGVDASHPDIAPNFDHRRSRNFVMDIPELDGPCEVPTCIDPPDVDPFGHGTHVAGIVGAARNDFGVAGVAPDVNLVNLRAGQDSGYFFLYATVAALVEAGDLGLDVVNMSFYVDPWLYNCTSRDDYIEGDVTDEELAEQTAVRDLVSAGLDYAHERGVTLVTAAGNRHENMVAPERFDDTSPNVPPGSQRPRTVTSDCLTMPVEGPHVLVVSAVGPSGRKSDYSNYGLGTIDIAAPGGWQLDLIGTPDFNSPENRILSSVPLDVAIQNGWVDENGEPLTDLAVTDCDRDDTCGVYFYTQGTSMSSPHVAGVAALVIERHGQPDPRGDRALDPEVVADILATTATDHPCPEAGFEDYTPEGRPPDWNAICEGTTEYNGLYGEGIVSAVDAVGRRR